MSQASGAAASVAALASSDHMPATVCAANAGGLKPIEAMARDLFRRQFVTAKFKAFDSVVFDRPRQSAEAQARRMRVCFTLGNRPNFAQGLRLHRANLGTQACTPRLLLARFPQGLVYLRGPVRIFTS